MAFRFFIPILFLAFPSGVFAQATGTITGVVLDEDNIPLAGATIQNLDSRTGSVSSASGTFALQVPEGVSRIEISFIGYKRDTLLVNVKAGETSRVIHRMVSLPSQIDEVFVESWIDRAEALSRINLKSLPYLPVPSGNFEAILATLGASIRNELSSQYSVRGGNFDENLIYVNDVEIYRPLLVKSGQQEGLSFVNSSLVSSIQFAAGGFDARFGDKMSSVLDIRYKRPSKFNASASAGFMGAAMHAEGASQNKKLTWIGGVRYKTNQYLLNSLDTEGDYKPSFLDVQTFVTYSLTKNLEINFLGNLARNSYKVIPESRETAFGTYQETLNFTVFYEGQEVDRFTTMLGAVSLDFRPGERLFLKLTGSGFVSDESVTYDILGQYRLDLLDNTKGSETADDSLLNIGVGGNLIHARNYLNAQVTTLSHKGYFDLPKNRISWGLNLQQEVFDDRIREWEMIDSAGYTLPYSISEIKPHSFTIADNQITVFRYTGYIQHTINLQANGADVFLNTGFRFNYGNLNRQFVFSPRFGIAIIPDWNVRIRFTGSLGWYQQPPFYKEMRDPQGKLYTDLSAQQSIHILVGSAVDYSMWDRPFRLSGEIYYKWLNSLVPYVVDDVDVQYLPGYQAQGYATGIEFKLNGEFVRDAESWVSLSFLQTHEDRIGDPYGAYPRPTDQLVNVGLFFQDYFPNNPSYRVHTGLFFGSRLPYHSPDYDRPDEVFRLSSYKRIDIGLSKSLVYNRSGNRNAFWPFLDDLWFSAEFFNLFGFENQASYQWVRTVSNQQGYPNLFAVPNYLTGRLFNLRINARF